MTTGNHARSGHRDIGPNVEEMVFSLAVLYPAASEDAVVHPRECVSEAYPGWRVSGATSQLLRLLA